MGILTFFMGPVGRIFGYGLAIITILGMVWGGIKIHDHNVRVAALAEYNQKQIEQVAKENKANLDALLELKQKALDDVKEMNERTKKMDETAARISKKVDELEDKLSSDILKETIKGLIESNK